MSSTTSSSSSSSSYSSSSSSSSSSSNKLPQLPQLPQQQQQPSLPYRMTSSLIMGLTASISRIFLYGFNTVEVTGLQRFLDILDQRKDVEKRERGLITVCNHISVFDDPLMWGVLPFRQAFDPTNHRWGLGAHDICFKNSVFSAFFSSGQVLPTYRLKHTSDGGLFQPTIAQAIRLLSARPFVQPPSASGSAGHEEAALSGYPHIYAQNRHSWVHVFPEACVHQHPKMFMRYFKWGVSRMILESEPMPDVMPMFIDGTQHMMPEDRGFPRFLPRFGVKFRMAFGELLDMEKTFGDLRAQWQELVKQQNSSSSSSSLVPGGELTDDLKYGEKAVMLRIECARRVREEVQKVRRSLGYPEEEPAGFELAETWARDPPLKKFKSNVDDSLVNKRQ